MAKYNVEIQDSVGNVYYPHSKAETAFLSESKKVLLGVDTVEEALVSQKEKLEDFDAGENAYSFPAITE